MTVYVIAQLSFKNEQRYRKYQSAFHEVFLRSNGRLLCADEQPVVLEGNWRGDKVVLMEFPSKDEALAMLESADYQEISIDRRAGANTVSIMARGL